MIKVWFVRSDVWHKLKATDEPRQTELDNVLRLTEKQTVLDTVFHLHATVVSTAVTVNQLFLTGPE